MRFIHVADVHLDMPFKLLGELGERRRSEQLEIFKSIIKYIEAEKIEYLFIAGDFYEHEYIRDSAINLIIDLFKSIPDTKIFISPGNHDPYIKGSMYERKVWPDNVYIFKEYEVVETEDFNIHGYGFIDFFDDGIDLREIHKIDNGKPNIFVIHGDLDGSTTSKNAYGQDIAYNPMNATKLSLKGFDYIALGHVHKSNFKESINTKSRLIYPGSFMNYRFKDDDAGIVYGIFKTKDNEESLNRLKSASLGDEKSEGRIMDTPQLYLKHIDVDSRKYEQVNIDISEMESIDDIKAKILGMDFSEANYIKIILTGTRTFDVNTNHILNEIYNKNILRVEDESKLGYDLEEIAKENTLKGIFVKKALDTYHVLNDPEEKMKIMKAIEITLEEMREI